VGELVGTFKGEE